LAKIQAKPKTQLDRIRAVDQHYADLLEKNRELYARQEEVHAETQRLGQEERRSQVSWVVQAPKPKPQPIRRHAGAVALVGDLLSPQSEEELNPPPPRPSWAGEQRARELGAESEALAEAIKLLAPEITKARKEYSRKVAGSRKAEYTEIVERVVEAANMLGGALLDHHEFINQQRLDGVAWRYFRPLNLDLFGNLDEPFTPLLGVITDAVEKGHVGAGQIPDWKMPVSLDYLQGGT
jgi:hypothetical protein